MTDERPSLRVVSGTHAPKGYVPERYLTDLQGVATVKRHLADTLESIQHRSAKAGDGWLGGLLLYGPPGCGKVFAAESLSGELGATFHVIDMAGGWDRKTFAQAIPTPGETDLVAIHFENIDAPGAPSLLTPLLPSLDQQKNSIVTASATFPWQVSINFACPRRLSHVLLVLPPDAPSRADFLKQRSSGIVEISTEDMDWIVQHTEGHSFSDLKRLLQHAIELAGDSQSLTHEVLRTARHHVAPSSSQWLTTAGHHAMMNEEGGLYDDLLTYFHMRQHS